MRETVNGQRWVFDGFMSWLNDVNSWPDNECQLMLADYAIGKGRVPSLL